MTRRPESGQASVLLIGVLFLGCAFAGLAVDGTRLFTARRDLTNVVDSAALAGASEIDTAVFRASGGTDVRLDAAAARAEVAAVLRDSNLPAGTRADVEVEPTRVAVRLQRPVGLTFLGILGVDAQMIGAHAQASPNTG
jgi:uncharacterized membrane protein